MAEPMDILNALKSGDLESARDDTASILYQKIGDAMSQKKIDIASTMGSIENSEIEVEPETTEEE
jgi:hypothetical protein